MPIKPYITKEEDYLITLRRWFHAHPEPSLQEFETYKKIASELDALGIPHRKMGDTGLAATIRGEKPGVDKIIVLRADIDALCVDDLKDVPYASKHPGCCHACGHDVHMAALLGAAKVLQEKRAEFAGEVRLFFQQAEEIGGGAKHFIAAGLLEGVHRVFGGHVIPTMDTGTVGIGDGPRNASSDYFKIEVKGRSAHAATPDKGVDALYIAAQIVNNLQSIVARNTHPIDSVLVSVGKISAGTQYNSLAETALIEGTTRAFTPEIRTRTNETVQRIAESTAHMFGGTADVTIKHFAPPLINDYDAAEDAVEVAVSIVGESHIRTSYAKALWADDFADFLEQVKGVYVLVGVRDPAGTSPPVALHHGLFDVDEKALLTFCNLYVDFALYYMD